MAAARLKAVPMSGVDADFKHIDLCTNMMTVSGVNVFDGPVDFERLKATYVHRMVERYPRFRMRIRERGPLQMPVWEEDPHFDISCHVHRVALRAPHDQAAFHELAGDLISTPLDYGRPPWDLHLVENYAGSCATVWRLSHCFADGAALMQIVAELADDGPDAPWPQPPERQSGHPRLLDRLAQPARSTVSAALRLGDAAVREAADTVQRPGRALELARTGAGAAAYGAGFAARYLWAWDKILLLPPDPRTAFKGKMGVVKRVSSTAPLPLAEVKAVGKALGGTVNDTVLTAVAGGLRRYLQGRGEKTKGLRIRALVPVNLRGPEEAGILGTHAGLTYCSLPVGIEDVPERMAAVKRAMDAIKHSPEGQATFDWFNLWGFAPPEVKRIFVELFTTKATSVMTNVPGPRQAIYLAGQRVNHMMFWVCTAASVSLGVSICSYNGEIVIGFQVDAGLAPDPENIAAGYEAEFEAMRECARAVQARPG